MTNRNNIISKVHRYSPALPAAALLTLGSAAWIFLRANPYLPWLSLPAPTRAALTAGWLLLTLLLATLAVILAAAALAPTPRRQWLSFALAADSVALLLLLVALTGHQLTLPDGLRVFAVLTPWLAFWTALTGALARQNVPGRGAEGGGAKPQSSRLPPSSVGFTLALAILLFSAPVTLTPVLRTLPGPASVQDSAVSLTSTACPSLCLLDAASPSLPYVWYQGRAGVMYHLTPLGQDLPAPQPAWWKCALLYTVLTLLAAAATSRRARN